MAADGGYFYIGPRDPVADKIIQAAEMESLRADAMRWRFAKAHVNPLTLLAIAWGTSKEACAIGDDPDAAMDASIKACKWGHTKSLG